MSIWSAKCFYWPTSVLSNFYGPPLNFFDKHCLVHRSNAVVYWTPRMMKRKVGKALKTILNAIDTFNFTFFGNIFVALYFCWLWVWSWMWVRFPFDIHPLNRERHLNLSDLPLYLWRKIASKYNKRFLKILYDGGKEIYFNRRFSHRKLTYLKMSN